jgi:hypothetical protein
MHTDYVYVMEFAGDKIRHMDVATGTGELHLIGGAFAVQSCLIEGVEHLLGRWLGVDGRHRLWDTDGEDPSLMQSLAHRGVVDAKVTCHGMDGQARQRLDL